MPSLRLCDSRSQNVRQLRVASFRTDGATPPHPATLKDVRRENRNDRSITAHASTGKGCHAGPSAYHETVNGVTELVTFLGVLCTSGTIVRFNPRWSFNSGC